ncbi:hypothetical protein V1477_001675 [Vespula maculifrons]|uniref:Uncharacterized protein n=1 Tax=Vespula maculifrons TaxID=7453 RepID=A0ABD2CZU3_VESMC
MSESSSRLLGCLFKPPFSRLPFDSPLTTSLSSLRWRLKRTKKREPAAESNKSFSSTCTRSSREKEILQS